jgi:hypothetical protein
MTTADAMPDSGIDPANARVGTPSLIAAWKWVSRPSVSSLKPPGLH